MRNGNADGFGEIRGVTMQLAVAVYRFVICCLMGVVRCTG